MITFNIFQISIILINCFIVFKILKIIKNDSQIKSYNLFILVIGAFLITTNICTSFFDFIYYSNVKNNVEIFGAINDFVEPNIYILIFLIFGSIFKLLNNGKFIRLLYIIFLLIICNIVLIAVFEKNNFSAFITLLFSLVCISFSVYLLYMQGATDKFNSLVMFNISIILFVCIDFLYYCIKFFSISDAQNTNTFFLIIYPISYTLLSYSILRIQSNKS